MCAATREAKWPQTYSAGLRNLLFRRRALLRCRAEHVEHAPNGYGACQGRVLEARNDVKLFAVIAQPERLGEFGAVVQFCFGHQSVLLPLGFGG